MRDLLSTIWFYSFGQINFNTLLLLFNLMGVVAGFQYLGYIDAFAGFLVKKTNSLRSLALCLVAICFFFSMLVTNDVALIIIVPFTITILERLSKEKNMISLIVLETIAANLGSMLTPIGNPQNVFLYETYKMELGPFFKTILPYGILSFVILLIVIFLLFGKEEIELVETVGMEVTIERGKKIAYTIAFLILFALCLLNVLRIMPHVITFVCVGICLLIIHKELFREINYGLLIKFAVLFVIVGDLASIPVIKTALGGIVGGHEFLTGILVSQVVSNVPAAILLSNFTNAGYTLLLGVDVGGLGTLIASMASMISYDYYVKCKTADKGKYVLSFLGFSVILLVVLMGYYYLFG